MSKEGYLYITCGGEKYLHEIIESAKSLRRVDNKVHITLIIDKEVKEFDGVIGFEGVGGVEEIKDKVFDTIIVKPYQGNTAKQAYLYKVSHIYTASPYEKTFYVDTDTYFYEDCGCLFKMLEHFDICMAMAPMGGSDFIFEGKNVKAYPNYNGGVIVFKKNDVNKSLFANWLKIYKQKIAVLPHDQPAFMESLLNSKSRIYVLSSVWNARTPFFLSFPPTTVKIVHGRHKDYEKLRTKLNKVTCHRVWDPQKQKCIYQKKGFIRKVGSAIKRRINGFS